MIVRELITRLGFQADESKVKSFDRGVQGLTRNIDRMVKVTVAAGAAVTAAIGTAFVRANMNAESEQKQLAAVLNSTGHAAGFTRDQLNSMNDAMRRMSATTGGDITNAQTALLAFTNIAGDEFRRAMQSSIDMAARTGMSVVSAAETIGRALDVPSQGMAALSRQGFRFSEAEKEMVKQLERAGKTAEAQKFILKALESTYGGAAKAARDTLGGALTNLRETINDLLTGQGSLDSLRKMIDRVSESLEKPEVRQGLERLGQLSMNFVEFMLDMISVTGRAVDALGGMDRIFRILIATITTLLGTRIILFLIALRKQILLLGAATAVSPIGLIVLAIGALVFAILEVIDAVKKWVNGSPSWLGSILGDWTTMKNTIGGYVDFLSEKWRAFVALVSKPFEFAGGLLNRIGLPSTLDMAAAAPSQVARQAAPMGAFGGRAPVTMNVRNDVKVTVPEGTTADQAVAINRQVEQQMQYILRREVSNASLAMEGL